MKTRILHLITTLEPDGAQTLLLDTLPHLTGRHEFTVGYLAGKGTALTDGPPAGIEIVDLSRQGRLDPLILPRLARLIRSRNFDIIHTHLVHAGIAGRIASMASLRGTRMITTRHYAWDHKEGTVAYRLENLLTRRCSAVIAVSDAVRSYLLRQGILPEERIFTVPNGVDTRLFDPGRVRAGEAPRRVLGSIGRLHPQKGHAILLQAAPLVFREHPDVVLEILGTGPLEDRLRSEARRPGIADRVTFPGVLPHRKVPERMAAWDLAVFPSLWEGFGIAAAEAMAMERPVVASRIEGLREVVEDGATGILVEPGDPQALATAIIGILSDRVRAAEMGRQGRIRVLERFPIQRTVAKLAEVYDRVLSCEP